MSHLSPSVSFTSCRSMMGRLWFSAIQMAVTFCRLVREYGKWCSLGRGRGGRGGGEGGGRGGREGGKRPCVMLVSGSSLIINGKNLSRLHQLGAVLLDCRGVTISLIYQLQAHYLHCTPGKYSFLSPRPRHTSH